MATKRPLANYAGRRREMATTDTVPKINLQELLIGTITAGITDQAPTSAAVFTALAGKVAKAGDSMTGILHHAYGTVGTQQISRRVGWVDGIARWAEVIEADAGLTLWSYDSAGANATPTLQIKGANAGGSDALLIGGQTVWHNGNLVNPMTLDTAQTVTAQKTFSADILIGNTFNLLIGGQSGGGVGQIRVEHATAARIGVTTTGSRRYTIGSDGANFTIRDESGAANRLSLSSTGAFTFNGPMTVTPASLTVAPFTVSGAFTGSGRLAAIVNTDTSTNSVMGLTIASGATASGAFATWASEYTGVPAFAGFTGIQNTGGAGILFSAETASGIVAIYTGVARTLRWAVSSAGDLVSGASNTYDIGAPSNLVANVYATNFWSGTLELGYRDIPRVTGGFERGKMYAIAAGVTVNTSAVAATYSVYNNSAAAVTLTQGAGVTMRLAGTATTGSRTLAARGIATLWFNTASEVVVSGNVT